MWDKAAESMVVQIEFQNQPGSRIVCSKIPFGESVWKLVCEYSSRDIGGTKVSSLGCEAAVNVTVDLVSGPRGTCFIQMLNAQERPCSKTVSSSVPVNHMLASFPIVMSNSHAVEQPDPFGFRGLRSTREEKTCFITFNVTDDDQLRSSSQPAAAASPSLGALLLDPTYADMTLIVEDQRLPAHKCLLCPSSDVFRTMFDVPMKEAASCEVIIPDFPAEVVKAALQFIYTSRIADDQLAAVVSPLWAFAVQYMIPALEALAETFCIDQLTADNAIEALQLAEQHDSPALREAAMLCIVEHSRDIKNKPAFLERLTAEQCRDLLLAHWGKLSSTRK